MRGQGEHQAASRDQYVFNYWERRKRAWRLRYQPTLYVSQRRTYSLQKPSLSFAIVNPRHMLEQHKIFFASLSKGAPAIPRSSIWKRSRKILWNQSLAGCKGWWWLVTSSKPTRLLLQQWWSHQQTHMNTATCACGHRLLCLTWIINSKSCS